MSKHKTIGIKGEQIAADFLQNKGYVILYRNWRTAHKEIDIIAYKAGLVVIVEIKTRSGAGLQFPEEAVNQRKRRLLKEAALVFMEENREYVNVRYDIVSVAFDGEHAREIVHFEEAFH